MGLDALREAPAEARDDARLGDLLRFAAVRVSGHRSSANDCEKKEENASRSGAHLHRLQVTEAAAQSVYGIRLAPVQSAYRILEVAPVFHKLRRYALPWILWVS